MELMAIDPGTSQSAVVFLDNGKVLESFTCENAVMVEEIRGRAVPCVIEMIASYGRPVGADVFETCVWIGRFLELTNAFRMYRKDVCKHLCGNAHKVTDAVIRQRLIDIYGNGQGKSVAIGLKRSPGPLYQVKADQWQALALGVAFGEQKLGWKIQP